jgi:hypothetical protein
LTGRLGRLFNRRMRGSGYVRRTIAVVLGLAAGIDYAGDVLILRQPGRRLLVAWSQVEQVWVEAVPKRQRASPTYAVQNDGHQRQRFTVPLVFAPYLNLLVFGFRVFAHRPEPLYELYERCRARGVQVHDGNSELIDTDGLFVTWATLHDVVTRHPDRYGGAYQGPGRTGILQVVPRRTDLRPGQYTGANLAVKVGLDARELMADVTVVECGFSRARLTEIERAVVRMRAARPELGIGDVAINGPANAVEVRLLGMTTVLRAAAFDQFGAAVRLVEQVAEQ